jgi:hypothetical protein
VTDCIALASLGEGEASFFANHYCKAMSTTAMLKNSVAIEKKLNSWPFEIADVLVRFDHVARFIVNANHRVKSQVTG